jgi:hypothetical protein
MIESGVVAQRRCDENASRAVHVDIVGVTDEQSLQARGSAR